MTAYDPLFLSYYQNKDVYKKTRSKNIQFWTDEEQFCVINIFFGGDGGGCGHLFLEISLSLCQAKHYSKNLISRSILEIFI